MISERGNSMKGMLRKAVIGILSVAVLATCFGGTDVLAKKKVVHNVTYIYGLKSVTVQVAHGQNAPVPTDTDVAGFRFVSWIGSAANVTEDRVILGAYVKNATQAAPAYTAYNSGGGDYRNGRKVNGNKSAPFPEWWNTLNIQKGIPGKTCAVYWLNGNNNELWKVDMVPYGASLPTPADPCIAGLEFVGWEGDWTNVTEDRVIRAWYFKTYKVKFVCGKCGECYDEKYVRNGDSASTDNHYHEGWKFDHYVKDDGSTYGGGGITGDTTLTAVYVQ